MARCKLPLVRSGPFLVRVCVKQVVVSAIDTGYQTWGWTVVHRRVDRGDGIGEGKVGLQQVQCPGLGYRLGPALGIELAIEVIDVRLDRAHGDDHLLRNLPVR